MSQIVQEGRGAGWFDRGLRVLSFPALMGLVFGWGWLGKSMGLPEIAILVVAFVMTALSLHLLEQRIPYQASWNEPQEDVKADVGYLGLLLALEPLAKGVLFAGGLWIARDYGQWTLLWPSGLPMVFQVVLAVVVGEFLPYWYHRISHEWGGFLWKIHETHHSSERLYWLNGARFHPLNAILNTSLRFLPLMLLGAGPEALFWFALVTVVVGFFNHANADVRLGPLNWVFGMSELHRWHHHRELSLANANYGGITIFWDIVFRTRLHPQEVLPAEQIGLEEPGVRPHKLWRHMLAPFCECWAVESGTTQGEEG